MHCTPALFALCHELKGWGIEPSFEVGQIVARGFADLGSEEFLVLPGPKILSLTAGTVKDLPQEHRHFFYWIPTVEECGKLLERSGCDKVIFSRADRRTWIVECGFDTGGVISTGARSLHEAVIQALIEVRKSRAKSVKESNG